MVLGPWRLMRGKLREDILKKLFCILINHFLVHTFTVFFDTSCTQMLIVLLCIWSFVSLCVVFVCFYPFCYESLSVRVFWTLVSDLFYTSVLTHAFWSIDTNRFIAADKTIHAPGYKSVLCNWKQGLNVAMFTLVKRT